DDQGSGTAGELGQRHRMKRSLATTPNPPLRDLEHRLKLGAEPDGLALGAALQAKCSHDSLSNDRYHGRSTTPGLEVADLQLGPRGSGQLGDVQVRKKARLLESEPSNLHHTRIPKSGD